MEQNKLQKLCDLADEICEENALCRECPLFNHEYSLCIVDLLKEQNAKEQTK